MSEPDTVMIAEHRAKAKYGKGFCPLNNMQVAIRDTLVLIGCYKGKLIGMGGMPKNIQDTLKKKKNIVIGESGDIRPCRYKGRQASHELMSGPKQINI